MAAVGPSLRIHFPAVFLIVVYGVRIGVVMDLILECTNVVTIRS